MLYIVNQCDYLYRDVHKEANKTKNTAAKFSSTISSDSKWNENSHHQTLG